MILLILILTILNFIMLVGAYTIVGLGVRKNVVSKRTQAQKNFNNKKIKRV